MRSIYVALMICLLLLCACSAQTAEAVPTQTNTPVPTAESTPAATPTPIETTVPEPTQAMLGVIQVSESDTLERDIIPQLCSVFGMSETEIKDTLAEASDCDLINPALSDFRRMEGIILPGEYVAYEGETLKDYVIIWLENAQQRYAQIWNECSETNDLEPYEQLSVASVVEAECLGNAYYQQTASVFLNRLEDGMKMQSCVTVEYAISYQRPYLTRDDVAAHSAYNTYENRGVPVGPICVVDDESLKAAISKTVDSEIYFFFYDYALDEMFFFSEYTAFKEACGNRLGNIHCHGAGLGVGHQTLGAQDATDATDNAHHVRSGDDHVEIKPVFGLDFLHQFLGADEIRACLLGFLYLVAPW